MGMVREFNPDLPREEMIAIIMNNQKCAHVDILSKEFLNGLELNEVRDFYRYSLDIRIL